MEWEVMFLCNAIGVLLLFFIAFFHLIGVEKESNGEIIDTQQSSNEAISFASAAKSAKWATTQNDMEHGRVIIVYSIDNK